MEYIKIVFNHYQLLWLKIKRTWTIKTVLESEDKIYILYSSQSGENIIYSYVSGYSSDSKMDVF